MSEYADLLRLTNPETGVRHAVQEDCETTICGIRNEDYELSFDGEWSEYDDGSVCGRCTRMVTAGLRALWRV